MNIQTNQSLMALANLFLLINYTEVSFDKRIGFLGVESF